MSWAAVDLFEQIEASSNAQLSDTVADDNAELEDDDADRADSPLDASCHEIDDMDESSYFNYLSDQVDVADVRHRPSPVWQYFVYRRTCAVCKLCRKSLKRSGGNTSNLFQHLKRVHRKQYVKMMADYRRRKMEAAAANEVY